VVAIKFAIASDYNFDRKEKKRQKIYFQLETRKEGKDRRYISNWRPDSLINVDAKIGSNAIARRLQEVLPDIIHNQNAYC